jgi:hypothetical protein
MKHPIADRLRTDDDGSALVLALMVVLLVGALLAAAIDYTRTGLLVTPQVRNDRNEVTTIQSAVDGAINNIRGSSVSGRTATPTCPEFTPPVPTGLSGVEASEGYRVTCSAQPTDGSTVDGAPPYAIQALGSAPDGIRQVNPSNDELVVDGGIYSKGLLSVGGGSKSAMTVYGSAISETSGGCSGALYTTDLAGPMCGPQHAQSDGGDPSYGPGIANQAALESIIATGTAAQGADPVPTCSGGVATFPAGYYGERPDLLLDQVQPSCSASVWRFAPGLYYFDYAGVWDLGSKRVIAGTPSGSTALGEACSRTGAGAQFVFGGESRIYTRSSASADNGLEVCGPHNTSYYTGPGTPQRIAIYGLTSRNSLGAASSGSAKPAADGVTGVGGWTDESQALAIDGNSAAVVLQKNKSASLTWSGFAHAPKGARVTKVSVELEHFPVNTKSAKLAVSGPGGVSVSENVQGCTTCLYDITSSVASSRTDVLWRYLRDLSVTYEVEGKDNQVAPSLAASLVDGVRFVVEYTTPALRAQTCPGSGCVFVQSTNNPNLYVHGTVYTPSAAWAVNVHNSGETIFDRGVILRDLAVNVSGSSKQTTSPFQLPHGGSDGRKVLFRGWVDGVERVRACVRYTDQAPVPGTADTVAFPGYSLTVTQWLVFHHGAASATLTCPS